MKNFPVPIHLSIHIHPVLPYNIISYHNWAILNLPKEEYNK